MEQQYETAGGGWILATPKTMKHMAVHPEVKELLPEVIGRITLPADHKFLSAEVDLGRIVGQAGRTSAEPVKLTEFAVFAHRTGRDKPSRVALGPGPETSKVTVLAFPDRTSPCYILLTAYLGTPGCREPWDRKIRLAEQLSESIRFWCSNALVYEPQVMGKGFVSTWAQVLQW